MSIGIEIHLIKKFCFLVSDNPKQNSEVYRLNTMVPNRLVLSNDVFYNLF